MEPKKIICHKPGPQWPKPLPTETQGIHHWSGEYFVRGAFTPAICSALGHDTSFRDGVKDECRTCGVKW